MYLVVWLGRFLFLYLLYRFLGQFLKILEKDDYPLGLLFVGCAHRPPLVSGRLLFTSDEESAEKQSLKPGDLMRAVPLSMGRGPLNDVELPEEAVAMFHLRLEQEDGLVLRKLDQNSVYVNGNPVEEEAVLSLGDVLNIGSYLFVVVKGFADTGRG